MVSKRVEIWIMLLIMYICDIIILMNMNIAILSMIDYSNSTTGKGIIVCNMSNNFLEITPQIKSQTKNKIKENNIFKWNKFDENMILGAPQSIAWLPQLLSGVLIHKYGSKSVIGYSQFLGGILSSFIPYVSYLSPIWLMYLRSVQGFLLSLAAPTAVFGIIGKWSPPDERGKFLSVFLAVPLGMGINNMLFGYIADNYGWSYVFHVTSALSIVWFIMWLYFVYDSPEIHPRISKYEKQYLIQSLSGEVSNVNLPIPWRSILTSLPFLLVLLCHYGLYVATFVVAANGPAYLKYYYGYTVEQNGFISGAPYIARAIVLYFSGLVSDIIIRKKLLSLNKNRKLFTFIGTVLAGLPILGLVLIQCNAFLSIAYLTIYIILSACFTTGPSLAIIDLSPNFCHILQSICGSIGFTSGFCMSLIISYLWKYNDAYMVWKKVFLIVAFMNIVPGVLYLIFGTSEQQPWNWPHGILRKNESKLKQEQTVSKIHQTKNLITTIDEKERLMMLR